MEKIAAVILAAGKGTRMNEGQASPIPKVMFEIGGVPMIRYHINNIKNAGINDVVLVVGYKQDLIKEFLGGEVNYATQEEQLGTGHAVAMAKDLLVGKSEAVMVSYGDMPLFSPNTIRNLVETYQSEKPTVALISVDFFESEKWAYGRIIRNEQGDVEKIVEQRDCSSDELKIQESNAGFYIFDAAWLWDNIDKIQTENAQHEYYLTDLIGMAREQGKRIVAVKVADEHEALGINNPEQLKMVEGMLDKQIVRAGR